MKAPANILIIRTDRIGDVVLTIPMAKVIKQNLPGCKVSFLVRSYTAPLLEDNRFIDEVLILDENKKGLSFIKNTSGQLKNKNFDACFIVYPSFKIALAVLISGIKKRIGTGYRWYSFLFNNKIYEHRKYAEKNELEYNLSQLKALSIDRKTEKNASSFGISINPKALSRVKELLVKRGANLAKPVIIIHPGSGGSAVDLPLHRFKEIALLIENNLDVNLVFTGSAGEKELCKDIVSPEGIDLSGELELKELAALISLADIFIANSTGPLHLAAALGVYVIGFYPKFKVASPRRWGPYTENCTIFQPEMECSNCTRKQCEELNCMQSIGAFNVFQCIGKIYMLLHKNGDENV